MEDLSKFISERYDLRSLNEYMSIRGENPFLQRPQTRWFLKIVRLYIIHRIASGDVFVDKEMTDEERQFPRLISDWGTFITMIQETRLSPFVDATLVERFMEKDSYTEYLQEYRKNMHKRYRMGENMK